MEPFGPGNPEPLFAVADVRVERLMPMRGGHLRCTLVDGAGRRLRAVAWRSADTALGRRLLAGGGALHVAGRLKPDDWKGREASSSRSRTSPIRAWAERHASRPLARPPASADISAAPPAGSLRLSVRTSDFQSGKRGSTPLGTATRARHKIGLNACLRVVGGSNIDGS